MSMQDMMRAQLNYLDMFIKQYRDMDEFEWVLLAPDREDGQRWKRNTRNYCTEGICKTQRITADTD